MNCWNITQTTYNPACISFQRTSYTRVNSVQTVLNDRLAGRQIALIRWKWKYCESEDTFLRLTAKHNRWQLCACVYMYHAASSAVGVPEGECEESRAVRVHTELQAQGIRAHTERPNRHPHRHQHRTAARAHSHHVFCTKIYTARTDIITIFISNKQPVSKQEAGPSDIYCPLFKHAVLLCLWFREWMCIKRRSIIYTTTLTII